MATLADIYGCIKETCFKDDKGIYLNGERVALDNGNNNGYIRRNGVRLISGQNGCNGFVDSELPLKFVGACPGADAEKLERATIAAILSSQNEITSSDIDKKNIADSEGIPLEELTKFDGVAIVMVNYIEKTKKEYNPNCDYDIC